MAALALTGCGDWFCDEREQLLEVRRGSQFEAVQRESVRQLEADGWSCTTTGTVDNAFGNPTTTRYRCTICQ